MLKRERQSAVGQGQEDLSCDSSQPKLVDLCRVIFTKHGVEVGESDR